MLQTFGSGCVSLQNLQLILLLTDSYPAAYTEIKLLKLLDNLENQTNGYRQLIGCMHVLQVAYTSNKINQLPV